MRVAVRIPVQEIERRRVAAQQIVVHDEEPDQIVLAHEIECLGHVVAFEIADADHVLVGELELVFVDENRDVADLGKVEQRREQRRGTRCVCRSLRAM